ncbi:chromosome region maintenance protein 5/exportin [Schistosoma japonicum]|nr:chromosome region maintenance protein 5/exportin [Schistosoma japonicum]
MYMHRYDFAYDSQPACIVRKNYKPSVYCKMDRSSLLMAVSNLLDPCINNNRRNECFMVAENYKTEQFQFADVDFLCDPSQPSVVVLFGLQCLDHYLKHQWGHIDLHTKSSLKQNIFKLSKEINNYRFSREETRAFSLMLSQIIVFLIKCEWPQQWPTMLPEFLSLGKIGIPQTKLVLNSLLRLYEDVVQFQSAPPLRRRDILTSLNDNLTDIFAFALDSIVDRLLLTSSNSFMDCDSLEVCRESLCTLEGFLESCRLSVLTSWIPSEIAVRFLNLSRTLPFLSLITNLVGVKGVQSDALSLIDILLCRRIQPGSEIPDSYGPTIADSFLKEPVGSSSPCNNLIKVLCSTLSENPEYSDERHNFLRLFGQVMVHIGCHMIVHWKEYSYECTLCNCLSNGVCECPNLPSHLFQAILRLTAYPIHVISACTSRFWITVLRSDDESLLNLSEMFADNLFDIWRNNSLKVGQPSGTGIQSEWNRRIFETDEYTSFFARYRNDLVKCLSAGASCWPQRFLPLCISWIEVLTQTSPSVQDYDPATKFLLPTSPVILEWEALDSLLEPCLSAVEQSLKTHHIDMDISSKVKNLIRRILQSSDIMDPLITSKHLACLSMLLQHIDSNNDSELLVPFLNKIFHSLNSCPIVDESYIGTLDFVNRPRQVKTMHLASATSFLRFTRAHPVRMMPYFDVIISEVNKLWAEKICGSMEKGILLEALVILGFRVPQPIDFQFNFLKSLLTNVYGPWCGQDPHDLTTPFSELLRACESGAPGLVAVLGLDQTSIQLSNFESSYVQTRINLNHNVRSLLAVCRRLAEPCNNQQLENISLPILEPVLSPVLRVLRAFNELWLPETLKLVHPTLLPVLQHTDETKLCLLNFQLHNILKSIDDANPSLHRLRTFLTECHENLMSIVGYLFISLGSKLYPLPTEQLRIALHDGCCAAFEHLPDLKLNNLLRSIVRPFIRQCPRQYFETAIIPLVPSIVEAAIERTGARWNDLILSDGRSCDTEEEIAAELVLDRSARLLSRTCLDILRLIYTFNGYDTSEQSISSKEDCGEFDDDNDDVDMSETFSANGQSDTGNSVGHLAKLLVNIHSMSSEPQYNPQCVSENPLLLRSLAKILSWPDTSICSKAAQWISTLVEMLTNSVTQNNCSQKIATTPLPATMGEFILFGILCGLHVNGRNAENALNCLLYAGVKTYLAVDIAVARQNLRSLITRVLMNTLNGDKTKEGQIQQQLQTFEEKMFGNQDKPATMRAKRDAFKKIVDPIIGVPLSQRFRDEVQIYNLPPLRRPKWLRIRDHRNTTDIENDFGLTNLFSNGTD